MIRSPCSLRDSQECSPITHFKSINSLALSFLHRHGICSFIHPLWSCNKPNMVRLSQAFRQIHTSLEEKSDETLGLLLVVSFLKQMLVCLLFYLNIYTMFKGCFLFIITTKHWLHYPCCTKHPLAYLISNSLYTRHH